jgi:hypothetical protein
MPCAFAGRLPACGSFSPSSCWWLVTRAPSRPLWRPLCQVFRKVKRVSWPTSPFHLSPRRPRPPIPPRRYPRRRTDLGHQGPRPPIPPRPCRPQPTPPRRCPRPPIPSHPSPLRRHFPPSHLLRRPGCLARQSPPQAPAPPLQLRYHPPDRRCLGPRQPSSLPLPPRPNERSSP